MESVIGAVIAGVMSLAGVIISGRLAADRMQHKLELSQAVTDTRLEELAREVREHNNYARRMPVVEEQIKVINHRLADLEKGGNHD